MLPFLGLGTGEESEEEAEDLIRGAGLDINEIRSNPDKFLARRFKAQGGRIGYGDGLSVGDDSSNKMQKKDEHFQEYLKERDLLQQKKIREKILKEYEQEKKMKKVREQKTMAADGGSIKEPVAKKTMPLLDMGGKEMDLRAEGGFVPIGRMEKADDVPARLSKNEFVFTADAVRNAGDGNVDKGAEVMYNMMKNLESGGDVSEESQGLEGARKMFQTSQRLEEVL
jgi:hypothetical protein